VPVFSARWRATNAPGSVCECAGEQGDASALAHFEKARALEAEGDLAKAREEYLAGETWTSCDSAHPIRQPLIRETRPRPTERTSVDVQGANGPRRRVADSSGSVLMLEHVHPNAEAISR